jgi:DNA-binding NarL/FixJ family response regulator
MRWTDRLFNSLPEVAALTLVGIDMNGMGSTKVKVLIADDHAIVREGLKHLLACSGNIEVAGEAATGLEALNAVAKGGFDLLLLDLNMPGMDGTELIAQIRTRNPALPILVVSMHNESQTVRRALKTGASGYVVKDSSPETLLTAVEQVSKGRNFIEPALAERMLFNSNYFSAGPLHENLTDREYDIMRMLAKGKSINQIAALLAISNKTVSTHKARLMEKMNFSTNTELVRYAIENGLAG